MTPRLFVVFSMLLNFGVGVAASCQEYVASLGSEVFAPARPASDSTGALGAASREPVSTGIGIYFEDDVIFYTTDQNYTGGFGLSLGGSWVEQSGLTGLLKRLNQFSQVRRLYAKSQISRNTVVIVGSAFTPERSHLSDVAPVLDDRPYASLVGLQTRRVNTGLRWDNSPEKRDYAITSELTIAALGWNLAKALQTGLHRANRWSTGKSTPVDPLGWHNQISNGGEPTLLYRVGLERILAGPAVIEEPGVIGQLTGRADAMVGYYDNAAFGLSGRWGRLSTDYWEFTSNPTSSQNQKSRAKTADWELYTFFGARGRGVVYNALLQGQFRESVHTFSGRDLERLIGEAEAGLSTTIPIFGGNLGFTWIAFAGRTPEFKGPKKRSHTWGAFRLDFSPRLGSVRNSLHSTRS